MSMQPGNIGAFLDMIAYSEGTSTCTLTKNDGYDVLVGGHTFIGFADHPRILVQVRPGLVSTAAGRYQVLARYYDAYKALLHLPDFSPMSQDLIAMQQIKERGALQDIAAGNFESAVSKCKNIWASLPGAGYGQHENNLEDLQVVYTTAGGTLA